jgi:hypothetical protein
VSAPVVDDGARFEDHRPALLVIGGGDPQGDRRILDVGKGRPVLHEPPPASRREHGALSQQRPADGQRIDREDVPHPGGAPVLPQLGHLCHGGLRGEVGGVDRPDRCADKDVGLDAGLEQCRQHPDVDTAEVGAAGEHEPDHGLAIPWQVLAEPSAGSRGGEVRLDDREEWPRGTQVHQIIDSRLPR